MWDKSSRVTLTHVKTAYKLMRISCFLIKNFYSFL
jgi:hypothetical protein